MKHLLAMVVGVFIGILKIFATVEHVTLLINQRMAMWKEKYTMG